MIHPTIFLAAGIAFTNCSSFSNVVVPASDATAPDVYSGVYDFSKSAYDAISIDDSQVLNYELPDPTLAYLAVAAGMDSGGVQTIELNGTFTAYCVVASPRGVGLLSYPISVDISSTGTQAGGIGSLVSDGAYTYFEIDFSKTDQTSAYCGMYDARPFELYNPSITWTTTAIDYHGNRRTSPVSRAYYSGAVGNANPY